jgi:hypothetical protein
MCRDQAASTEKLAAYDVLIAMAEQYEAKAIEEAPPARGL